MYTVMSKHINEVFTNEHVVRENVIQFTVPDFCLFTFLLLFDLILHVEVHIGATQRFLDNCTYMYCRGNKGVLPCADSLLWFIL